MKLSEMKLYTEDCNSILEIKNIISIEFQGQRLYIKFKKNGIECSISRFKKDVFTTEKEAHLKQQGGK